MKNTIANVTVVLLVAIFSQITFAVTCKKLLSPSVSNAAIDLLNDSARSGKVIIIKLKDKQELRTKVWQFVEANSSTVDVHDRTLKMNDIESVKSMKTLLPSAVLDSYMKGSIFDATLSNGQVLRTKVSDYLGESNLYDAANPSVELFLPDNSKIFVKLSEIRTARSLDDMMPDSIKFALKERLRIAVQLVDGTKIQGKIVYLNTGNLHDAKELAFYLSTDGLNNLRIPLSKIKMIESIN